MQKTIHVILPRIESNKNAKNCGGQGMLLVENAHEPIVSKEAFEEVQKRKHKM